MPSLNIGLAQINPTVGDIHGNTQRVIEYALQAQAEGADLVIFPELTLTGYPPEDLLLRPSLYQRLAQAKKELCAALQDIDVIVGYPTHDGKLYHNTAGYFHQGLCAAEYHKQRLPNEGVFDEQRYFASNPNACLIESHGLRIALTLCEDIWQPEVVQQAKSAGADAIFTLNASPFSNKKHAQRIAVAQQRCQESSLPMLYCNCVGGQDGLVFDGRSFAMHADGQLAYTAIAFEEASVYLELCKQEAHSNAHWTEPTNPSPEVPAEEALIYQALVLGLRDYVHKNGFKKVLLGLSGGIDSALTAAIACDALGPEAVHAISLPSRYTASLSNDAAAEQAAMMGIQHQSIAIEPMVQAFEQALQDTIDVDSSVVHQNIQARVRGTTLMALANAHNALLLSTSNKSETAVGYTTLYGDMAGGYCPIKDVYKTEVYRLAQYRNTLSPCIPESVLTRAPTAELAPNQKDQDTLPPYEVLDDILERYIEHNDDCETITQAGLNQKTVRWVIEKVKASEHKRRQAPPGTKVTERAFDKDWRQPITSRY